jgi:beta-glucanase (GH16 family)
MRSDYAERVLSTLFMASFVFVVLCISCPAQAQAGNPARVGWKLTWSDEFNQPNGTAPDAAKWAVLSGGGGWGNQELEYYTSRPENVHVENGNLVIIARIEPYVGSDDVQRPYTSARLETKGKFEQMYGRVEARIKIPHGQGVWPAFWMLGSDIDKVGWPACGEIDIMENIGKEPSTVHGTLHGVGYTPAAYSLPKGKKFSDDFHVFAVEWEPKQIRFYVDDVLYSTDIPENAPAGTKWPFEHPEFILLNFAVGGEWPAYPDDKSHFPQQMLVDYVRVYEKSGS